MFSRDNLPYTHSAYPQPGIVGCKILEGWQDCVGRQIVRVTTAKPNHVESTDSLSEFIVLAAQLSDPEAQEQSLKRILEPCDEIPSSLD